MYVMPVYFSVYISDSVNNKSCTREGEVINVRLRILILYVKPYLYTRTEYLTENKNIEKVGIVFYRTKK